MPAASFLRRCIAPVFTAFRDDGGMDFDGQRNLLNFMLERGGIEAYFLRSGMGQMYSFSEEETLKMIEVACKHMAGRAPVLLGCSGIWNRDITKRPDPEVYLRQSIEFALHAQNHGASAVVYTLPEAIAPQEGQSASDVVLEYFGRIFEALEIPTLIYQPPNTQAEYHLTPELIRELAQMKPLVGAKVSYSDGRYNYDLIRAVKDFDFTYVTGSEFIYLGNYIAGSRAVIGQGCVLNPTILNHIHASLEKLDIEEALRAEDSVVRLCNACRFPQDFFKRYASENAYPVGRFHRASGSPYDIPPAPLTDSEYYAYKELLIAEISAFPL